jgi:broad specificity phosphatase PhoE
LANQHPLNPILNERLNELNNGLIDEMTEQDFRISYPIAWKAYMARKTDLRFPGGETGEETQKRICSFLEEKRIQYEGKI